MTNPFDKFDPQDQAGGNAFDKFDGDAEPKARGITGMARDMAAWGVKGAIGLVEAPVGIVDIFTGGRVGKALENEGGAVGFRPKQAREMVNDWHSEATKDAQRKFQEAEGIGGKFQAAIQNPSNIVGAVAESLPSMAGGAVAARGLLGLTRLGQMGAKGATIAGAAGEGIVMAGSQAEAIRQETKDGLLTPAQAGIAAATGGIGGLIGGASGRLANKLGVGDADTMLAQGAKGIAKQNADEAAAAAANPLVQQQAKGVPRQVIEGAITEGLLEELPQSVAEQLLQNLALDKPWSEGLDDAIVLGALSGGAMGAGAAGYRGLTRPTATGELGAAPADPGAAPAPAGQPLLGLPAPAAQGAQEPPPIQVSADGVARTQPYQTPGYVGADQGDVTDVVPREPQAVPVKPSEAMGLNPNAGALSAAAVQAVDSGASDTMQAAAAQAQAAEQAAKAPAPTKAQAEEIDLADIADPYERAYYESFFADAEDAQIGPEVHTWLQDDTNIPDLDAASSASDEDFLRALGANDQEITDAIASIASQPSRPQEDAQSLAGAQANEPADTRQGAGEAARTQGGQVDAGARGEADADISGVDRPGLDDAGRGAADTGAGMPETGGQPGAIARAPDAGNAQAAAVGGSGAVNDALSDGAAPKNLKEGLAAIRAKRAEEQAAQAGVNPQAEPGISQVEPGISQVDPGISQVEPGISQVEPGISQTEPGSQVVDGAASPDYAPVGDIRAVVPKQIPDMTDAEIGAAIAHYGPDHARTGKLQKEQARRAAVSPQQGATNGTQANQAQKTGAKQTQAGAAQAGAGKVKRPKAGKAAQAYDQEAGRAIRSGVLSVSDAEEAGVSTSITWPAHREWIATQAPRMSLRDFQIALKGRHGMAGHEVDAIYKARDGGSEISAVPAAPAANPKQAKALERVGAGKAFFFSKQKAEAFIADNELTGTHAVEQEGRSFHVRAAPAKANADAPLSANADATMDAAPAPKPAPVKPSVKARIEAARQTRADHFAPGNIVKSYSGHDRVVSYNPPPKEGGNWSVTVQAVVKQGDAWVDAPNESQRTHSTQPGERELKVGPVEKAQAKAADAKAPASLVQAAKDNGKLEIVTVGDKKPVPEQKGIALAGWTPETGDQGNTIWTKTANSEFYTATLDPAASTMEVTVLVDAVGMQIASFKVESSEQAARMASEAVARDVAETQAAAKPPAWKDANPKQRQEMLDSAMDKLAADDAKEREEKAPKPAATKAQEKPAADDLDAMFDDVLAEEVAKDAPKPQPKPTNLKEGIAQARAKKAAAAAKPEFVIGAGLRGSDTRVWSAPDKTGAVPAPRTATQAATSAAKNTASALGNAIDGLGALFGGAGKLGSGLSFDENTYAKAKPLFKQAVDNLGDAGTDLKEAMRAVIRMVMDKFGAQTAGAMKPYVVKFIQDMKDEQQSEDNNQESSNERPTIQGNGPKALDGMAPGKGEGLEGDGQSGLDLDGGRDERTEPGAGTDGAGPQGARSGGGGTPGVRAPSTGGSRGGRKPGRVKQDAAAKAAEGAIGTDTRPMVEGEPTSAANIPAANFRITDETRLGQGSEQVKFNDNLAAIRALQTIEKENRRATPQEQNTLARYVGWGGLASAFPDPLSGEFKTGWEGRGQELRDLLTDAEFSAARASTRNAHYTPRPVVEGMWRAATRLGFKGGLALETSMGTGNFLGLKPEGVPASFIGVEYDSLTARMAAALYPQSTVLHAGFQDVPLSDNAFTLSIGNPPYGQDSLRFQFKPEFNRASIHNQFFRASMDALRPGGLQVMVVSRYLMDAKDKSTRIALAQKARLVGAIRLPDVTFKENARTSVVTDIVILQKLTQAEQGMMEDAVEAVRTLSNKSTKLNFTERQSLEMRAARVPSWVEVSEIADPLGGEPMTVNNHFLENKANILGVLERSASSARGLEMTVRLDDAASLGRLLNEAVDRLPEGIQDFGAEILAGTEKRHKSMSDALRISLDRHEIGHVQTTRDGALERVIERDAPEGGMEMAMQTITAESPWSNELMQDGEGRWYRNEVVMDDAGKPVKAVRADGMPGRNNLVRRVTFENEGQVPDSLRLGATGFARLSSAVGLRDSVKRQIVMETEDAAGPAMEANRKELAKRYADFVTRFGPVNRAANLAMVMTMPDGGLVAALETSYQPEVTAARAKTSGLPISPEVAKPAPMLAGRVIPKFEPAAKASSGGDALAISLSETGRVDLERMAQLRGLTQDEVIAELQAGDKPLAFLDPESETWETADAYLSGSVVRKLKAANAAMLDVNIKALEAVQPVPWGAEDVTAMLGSAWVPPRVYADFAEHLTGGKATVSFSPVSNTFTLKIEGQGKSGEWDSDGTSAAYILGQLLNSKAIVVKDGDKPPRVDKERTDLAQIKAGEISAEFLDWVFRDSERRAALVALFNEKFNTRVVRQRDGSHLQLPGKVPDSVIGLRRHQKNVIWRGITDSALLMDHAVGAGKTFAAIARAMERRRMGMSRKPMVVVPNHLVDQWATDVYRLYPGAKVLAAGKKDFEAKRRRRLFGRIATGDWDLVIVPHSSFGFIGIDPATEARFLQLEMDQALQGVKEAQEQADEDGFESQRTKPLGVKEAELLVKKIQARMDSLNSGAKDRLLTFEQMGVDDLTVDESHEFKNLYYSSRLTNTRGMGNKIGSRKANDLYNKIRVLQEVPTNSVSFLTGTPISNSAVEMFTVMRYLAPKQLKEMGLEHFDAWRAQFVEASAAFEHTEAGTLKEVTRLGRNWSNMRSLMDLYYEFTDAVSLEDIQKWYSEDNKGKEFPVPKIKGGKRQLIAVKPTPAQEQQLAEVLDGFNMLPFMDDPYERNAERLRLMDRARKVSLDARAVDPYVKSTEPGGKLAVVSENVKRIYDATSGDKGAQMVFLDRSVPKSRGDDKLVKEYDALLARRDAALSGGDIASFEAAQESLDRYDSNEVAELRRAQAGGWNAYQQIKDNLVAAGIPANEIRFIQEANNDEQKQALFDAVNSGKVRVLLGSSQRMGAGTNAQKKLVALHHVDVTWKPSDIEQREGRIIRQGNELLGKYGEAFEVELLAYATERTVDAKMWDLNATKLKTINGIRKYDGAFTMEFEDADSIVMSEIAALASGNPLLLERVTVDTEITRLELQERAFRRRMYGIKDAVDTAEDIVQEGSARIEQARAKQGRAVAAIEAAAERKAERRVTIEGKEYETLAGAMAAAKNAIGAQQEESGKGRYSLSVNGKRLTTQDSIDEAVSEALGDFELFDATIDGATIAQRTRAARVLTAQMNELTRGIGNEESRTKKAGSMLGFDLVLDAASYSIGKGSFQIDGAISLVNESGATVASEVLTKVQVNQSYVPANLRNQLSKLFDRIARDAGSDVTGYLKERLERAQRELPELRERLKQEFPKAGELKDKRARLRELVSLLEGKAPTVNAPAPSEPSEGAEEVAFSRSTKPGPTFSPAARMQAVQAVEKTANAIRNAWANGPQVVVAFDMQDPVVPESARRADLKQRSGGARGAPEGFYYRGKVYLIASKLNTVNDAARVLFHEALGHHGLRGAFGKEMDGVLNQVATMRRAQVDAKIKEYGLRGVNSLDRRAAAEEVLAELAQSRPEIGFVKRAVAAIRNWLRANVPGFKSLDMTDADIIEAFILPARRFVEGGPRGPGGGVRIEPTMGAFSRATDQTQTESFKKWFSQDGIENGDGEPQVFIHVGGKDLGVIDAKKGSFGGIFVLQEHNSDGAAEHYGAHRYKLAMRGQIATSSDLSDFARDNPEVAAEILGHEIGTDDYYDALDVVIDESVSDENAHLVGGIDAPDGFAEMQKRRGSLAKAAGATAVGIQDEFGKHAILVVDSNNVKDLERNNGDFDGANPDIRFSRTKLNDLAARITGAAPGPTAIETSMGTMTPAQEAAYRNVAGVRKVPSLKERMDAMRANLGLRMKQALVDQFAPIRDVSQQAYMMARMSKGSDGAIDALLMYGKPFLRDGVLDVNAQDGGFAKMLSGLKGEHDRFFMWVAAQRGERLKAEGKENLMGDDDISALKTLNAGKMADGTVRLPLYAKALQDLNAFNEAALKVALESGLIDQDAYDLMKDQPYVPFYRLMEEEGGMTGPRFSSGLLNQKAWKKLRGGTQQLNADLVQNTLQNWSHLYAASARNRAALATMDAAEGLGVAHKTNPSAKGAVKVMRDGMTEHWLVEDPYLLEAISAISYQSSPLMKPLAKAKSLLTFGVTVNPTFKIRNLIRDSLSAISQSELGYNPLKNVGAGWKLTASDSQVYASMLASGGVIKFGTQENSDRLRDKVAKLGGVVLDERGLGKFTGQLKSLYDVYAEFGDRTENVNRAALYDQLIKKGHSHAEASFMARDLMDFSMGGSHPAVRFLTQTVPFLNARLQGLYKLGRAANENPRRFATMAAAVSLASLALMGAHGDDDDWKKREDWDRDAYWWFKVGGTAYRIPKPFELGAIGTLAERTAEVMFDDEMTGKRFMQRIGHMAGQTFSLGPVPQAFKPLLDIYANKDSFTGRAIESQADQRLRPQDRYNERTTEVAKLLGGLGLPDPGQLVKGDYTPLSPKQVDHLIRGYFSWLGVATATAADFAVRPVLDRGERPDMRLRDVFLAGNFVESLPTGSSRYVSQLYEQSRSVEQAYASYREAIKLGDTPKAEQIKESSAEKISSHAAFASATRQLSKINAQAKRIEASRDLSGAEKRARLEALEQQRDAVARRTSRLSPV